MNPINEGIDNTFMFVRLQPGAGYISLAQTLAIWETASLAPSKRAKIHLKQH